jgi:hypothetical protein
MNVRLSFLLIAVLIIFGGTFLVFHFTRAAEPTEDPPWLYKVDDDSIVHIEVTYQGKTVNYNKKPGGTTWYIQHDGQETPVLIEKWSGTPLLLSGPRVNRLLSQTVDNPKIYGLDPPESIVKVTERSGITYEFRMGDPTPDGQNQYAYLVGDPQLFTVPQIWADVINRLVYDPPYPRPYYIAKDNSIIHFGVLNTEGDAVDFRKQTGTADWVVMGAPGTPDTPVSQERWQQVMPLMNEPPISLVVSDKIDDATKYGLKPPKARVLITTTKEKPFDLYIGDLMPDGEHRYVQKRGDQKLFAVPESWVAMLEDLASDPPYASAPQDASSSSGN